MQDPPSRGHRPLQVRVSFAPTRLAAEHLAMAYDQVLPRVGRRGRSTTHDQPPAPPEQALREQEHA
jgi:hypothetical protein